MLRLAGAAYSSLHNDYTRLFIATDEAGWVLDYEARQLLRIASNVGISIGSRRMVHAVRKQSVFFSDQFSFFGNRSVFFRDNRLGVAYFHGRRFDLDPIFEIVFNSLKKNHERIDRIQVSNHAFCEFLLSSGVEHRKIFVIPIGVDLSIFSPRTVDSQKLSRAAYGIPQSSTVIGSFQKDGQGWAEGVQPKLIKGPDVFLRAVEILHQSVADLFVVLAGPARGYVIDALERLKIPYAHHYLNTYKDVARLYHALDLYIIPAREEGGPKALLEAMASAVPVVTTRVGQAVDLLQNYRNGIMVEVEDSEGLADGALQLLDDSILRNKIIDAALVTAKENSYDAQFSIWEDFFRGFVEF